MNEHLEIPGGTSLSLTRSPLTPAIPDKNTIEFASTLLRNLGSLVILDTNKKEVASVDNPLIFDLFKKMLMDLSKGKAVSVVPYNAELTTHQAANLINVSRPHLIKLLDSGEIPHHMVGTHRRVFFQNLMEYLRKRKAQTNEALDNLIDTSSEYGLY